MDGSPSGTGPGRPGRVRWVIGLVLTVLAGAPLVLLAGRVLMVGVLLLVPLLIGLVLLRSGVRLLRSSARSR